MASEFKDEEITVVIDDSVGDPTFMQTFLSQSKEVAGAIDFMHDQTQILEDLRIQSQSASTKDQQSEISATSTEIIESVNKRATRAKALLNAMKKETAAMMAQKTHPAEVRIRHNKHQVLVRKLVKEMKAHQIAKQRLAQEASKKMLRIGRNMCPGLKDEELQEAFRSGGFAQMAFQQQSSKQARNALREVNERYQDVEKLEQSVHQMYQMFVDLSTLVEEQGEVLNSIENNLQTSVQYVEKGNEQLIQAHNYAKKTRKCYCCLAIVGVVVLLIIVGVSAGSFIGA